MTKKRDGFVFHDSEGTERHFMPCTKSESERERALSGILRQMRDDWTVTDTRDSA